MLHFNNAYNATPEETELLNKLKEIGFNAKGAKVVFSCADTKEKQKRVIDYINSSEDPSMESIVLFAICIDEGKL